MMKVVALFLVIIGCYGIGFTLGRLAYIAHKRVTNASPPVSDEKKDFS